jgi:mono/diheme cytochrome c family protein
LVWRAFGSGFSARAAPSSFEARVAHMVLHASLSRESRNLVNPVAPSPDTLREGMEHYADHCASCHANDGNGDTLYGRGLNPQPPDLRATATQSKTDGELYAVIQNGVRMSACRPLASPASTTMAPGDWSSSFVICHRSLPTSLSRCGK